MRYIRCGRSTGWSGGCSHCEAAGMSFRGAYRGMSLPQYQPFPQTHWSLVQRAGMTDNSARHEALSTLLERYRPALALYLRKKRVEPDARDELLQGFIAEKLLAPGFLQRADPTKGRFRTFVLTSLDNYIIDVSRKLKVRRTVLLNDEVVAHDASRPEDSVELAWARELMRNVLQQMHQYCQSNGRDDLWKIFEGRVLRQALQNREPVSYEILADEVGVDSPTKAANLLVSAKRLYERLLRRAVGEYEMDEEAIDAEIADLCRVLSRDSSGLTDYTL